ncbi:hypothetical protein HY214_01065 [Candidatus Roizmanbacteria bacterium]|nr:hypothetical protein [Candidatus Roizmanbacteria bacterium]
MKKNPPHSLTVDAKITESGIEVFINADRFQIVYPKALWKATSRSTKELLKDNIAYSATIFVPQMLNIQEISYRTARPLSETFFYKNGIYDMPVCAQVDGRSSVDYVKRFFNTRFLFRDEKIKLPPGVSLARSGKKKKKALIPFSFGKESLLSYALAKEIGLEPILVNFIEPSHEYEFPHKKKLIAAFEKEMGLRVPVVRYGPGILRYGRYWDLNTELGWGLHVTEYLLLALPFAKHYEVDYIILGNEQSCNDTYLDKEGVLTFRAGYDQHREWTSQQSLLISLAAGRSVEVISLVEPLYELAETRVLHHRYPREGKYQMSCFAIKPEAKNNRWCQNCEKCAYIFGMCAAYSRDLSPIGFTENLFDENHSHLYETFFTRKKGSPNYGSQGELALAFYLANKNGWTGHSIKCFQKELLTKIKPELASLKKEYLGIHKTTNIPAIFKKKVLAIFKEELGEQQE